LQKTISSFLSEIAEYMSTREMHPCAPPYARFHGSEGDEVDVETGIPVLRKISGEGLVQSGEIPGGEYVCTEHWGPYDHIDEAKHAMNDWLLDRGRMASGPAIEIYWTDPTTEPDANRWRTELMRPLEPVARAASVA
jgi:effector-binding domain-containing protein